MYGPKLKMNIIFSNFFMYISDSQLVDIACLKELKSLYPKNNRFLWKNWLTFISLFYWFCVLFNFFW